MSKMKIQGSFVAIVTPFNRDGSVDFSAFRSPVSYTHLDVYKRQVLA